MGDVPIEPGEYLHGVTVVDLGDIRVARGMARRNRSACDHRKLTYDQNERRIWCQDCESTVEAFDAFVVLVEMWAKAKANHERREREIRAAEENTLISRATKVMDKVWRSQKEVPCCPHCTKAILPDDVVSGVATTSKALVLARRRKEATEASKEIMQ
jgi:hypothetical protein